MGSHLITPGYCIYIYRHIFSAKLPKITTALTNLFEESVNYTARALGSLSVHFCFQLGRIGIVLLLPSGSIHSYGVYAVEACILILGILCHIYTAFRGIEAVIWTNVLMQGSSY